MCVFVCICSCRCIFVFVCSICVCVLPVDVKICTSFVVHACKCFVDLISFRKIEKLSIENTNSKQAKCFICLPHTHRDTHAEHPMHCFFCAKFVLTATREKRKGFFFILLCGLFSCCFYNTNNENPSIYISFSKYACVCVCGYVNLRSG